MIFIQRFKLELKTHQELEFSGAILGSKILGFEYDTHLKQLWVHIPIDTESNQTRVFQIYLILPGQAIPEPPDYLILDTHTMFGAEDCVYHAFSSPPV